MSMIDVWLEMFNAMLIARCMLVCVCEENHQVRGLPKYSILMAKHNMKSQPKQPMCAN